MTGKIVFSLTALSFLFLNISEASAEKFHYGPWDFEAGVTTTVLYGYNRYGREYRERDNRDETYSSVWGTLSAAYNFNSDYKLALYYLPTSDGNRYLKNYRGNQWTNRGYGALFTPYGQFQAGAFYNVAFQFYVGAPEVGPHSVNDSNITNFFSNPNWNRNGGKIASYLTLNSAMMNTDNIANKFSYISPTFYGTTFGFTYMPSAYSNEGLINGYAPYRNDEAYVFALANEKQLGEFNLRSYLGYGIYSRNDKEYAAGASVVWRNWTLGGAFHRTDADGGRYPLNRQINDYLTPAYFDNFREGKAWDIGLSYTYGKFSTAVTYFNSKADNTDNEDEFIQFTNRYQVNKHLNLYATLAHVNFKGLDNRASDSNKGYSYIAGFRVEI